MTKLKKSKKPGFLVNPEIRSRSTKDQSPATRHTASERTDSATKKREEGRERGPDPESEQKERDGQRERTLLCPE
jgi:hypothetical protein